MVLDYALRMNQTEVLVVCSDEMLPHYAKPGDAGADLRAAEACVIEPGHWALVPTGVSIALPNGYVGLVHPRSGTAVKHGVTVLNAPGTIDAGYRGEIKVALINHSDTKFAIQVGDRIAQLLIQRVSVANFVRVAQLPLTERGDSGFGSTGVK